MDQPIRPKTREEIEADRLAEEQERIARLRQWDRFSALDEAVAGREATLNQSTGFLTGADQ